MLRQSYRGESHMLNYFLHYTVASKHANNTRTCGTFPECGCLHTADRSQRSFCLQHATPPSAERGGRHSNSCDMAQKFRVQPKDTSTEPRQGLSP